MFTFKNTKPISLVFKTPQEDLVFCTNCGGINARARSAVKVDCPVCDSTGYLNPYSKVQAMASYRPGAQKRWNREAGAVEYFGESSIKLEGKYKDFLSRAEWVEMDGLRWNFTLLREPGEAMGQHRLVLSLSRK